MNANELTDELKEISLIADNHTKIILGIAETMLRQQQVEIESMKNPIMQAIAQAFKPAKTLTDEEIGQIWKDCMESSYMQVSNPVGFARAILKKASEK
jgi:hypothetical protein